MNIFPTIIQQNSTGDIAFDIYSCLLKERIICCIGEINDEMSSSIIAQLLYLAAISKDDIFLYINSTGGTVTSGLSIIDTMNFIPNDVHTIGLGCCASMASIILACGTLGKRHLFEHCQVMIHQPIGGTSGVVSDIEITTQHLKQTQIILYKILSEKTKQSFSKIQQDCDRDYYLTSLEAIAYGLADHTMKKGA